MTPAIPIAFALGFAAGAITAVLLGLLAEKIMHIR